MGLGVVAGVQVRANLRLKNAVLATREALAQSEESRKQSAAVSTFLVDSFRSPDPSQDGRTVRVVDVLDRAADRLDAGFDGSPRAKTALLDAIARTFLGLGLYDRAGALFAKCLAINEATVGPDDPETLRNATNLALAYYDGKRIAEAIELGAKTLKKMEATLGSDQPDTLRTAKGLANAYRAAGRVAEAIDLHEATLKMMEAKLGPDHPDTLSSRNGLASTYRAAGRNAQATRLHEATFKMMEAKLGADHPETHKCRNNVAVDYVDAGRFEEAIGLYRATLEAQEVKLGPDHPHTLTYRNNLAEAYEFLGRWSDAEALRRDVLARRRRAGPPATPLLADDLDELGRHMLVRHKWTDAELILRECLAIREKELPDNQAKDVTMSRLGEALLGQCRYQEAEPLVVRGYERTKARDATILGWNDSNLNKAAERVIRLYEAWGKPDQVVAWKTRLGITDLPVDVFAPPPDNKGTE